jgi:hypothetical protein
MPIEVPKTFAEEFDVTFSTPEITVQHFLYETADLLQGERGERFKVDQVKHNYGLGFAVRAG